MFSIILVKLPSVCGPNDSSDLLFCIRMVVTEHTCPNDSFDLLFCICMLVTEHIHLDECELGGCFMLPDNLLFGSDHLLVYTLC